MTFAAIAVGGLALNVIGMVRQGQAAEAMGNYEAAQGEENAKQAAQIASTQEDEQRARARQAIGTQIAAGAESGAQLNGSAADLLRQSLFNAEADAMQIRYEGGNRVSGLRSQAAASRASGKSGKSAGYLSAVGSLAQAAAGAYGARNAPKAATTTAIGGK